MRGTPNLRVEEFRVSPEQSSDWGSTRLRRRRDTVKDGNNGAFDVVRKTKYGRWYILRVIVSDGEGWDHVSVSLPNRCPTWEEMCYIKRLFFHDDECVVQYHPRAEEYVDLHPYCLHLWRCQDESFPEPPSILVGPKVLR